MQLTWFWLIFQAKLRWFLVGSGKQVWNIMVMRNPGSIGLIYIYIWYIYLHVVDFPLRCIRAHLVSCRVAKNFADSQGGHDFFAYVWVVNSKAESKSVVRLKWVFTFFYGKSPLNHHFFFSSDHQKSKSKKLYVSYFDQKGCFYYT